LQGKRLPDQHLVFRPQVRGHDKHRRWEREQPTGSDAADVTKNLKPVTSLTTAERQLGRFGVIFARAIPGLCYSEPAPRDITVRLPCVFR
jgi:hypothetical protein